MDSMKVFFKLAILCLISGPSALGAADLELLRMSPSGQDVVAGQQIVFTFNQSVVPLGRMERRPAEIPVTITPSVDCEWRWLDRSSLACQLTAENTLRKATEYKVVMKPGIKTEAGETLKLPFEASFSTERLKIKSTELEGFWSPDSPVVTAYFSDVVPLEQLQGKAFFESESGETIPAKVFFVYGMWQIDKASNHARFLSRIEGLKEKRNEEEGPRTRWQFTSLVPLPADKEFQFKIRAGLRSTEGDLGADAYTRAQSFQAPGPFRFLAYSCQDSERETFKVMSSEKTSKACSPDSSVVLYFSSAPSWESVGAGEGILILKPELTAEEHLAFWSSSSVDSSRSGEGPRVQIFGFSPQQEYQLQLNPEKLRDVYDRPLSSESIKQLRFSTGDYRPDFNWVYDKSVLEKEMPTQLAARLVNMQSLELDYVSASAEGIYEGREAKMSLDAPKNEKVLRPIDIRSLIPLREDEKSLWLWLYQKVFFWTKEEPEVLSGAIKGFWKESPATGSEKQNRLFFSQVTPFQVQAKMGHFSSEVWITDLKTGEPVEGARVYLYIDDVRSFRENPEILSEVHSDSSGIAKLPGVVDFDPDRKWIPKDWEEKNEQMVLRVEKDSDLAFLPLSYEFQDYPYSAGEHIYASSRKRDNHLRAWGMTAQGLYRPGDQVDFKLIVRGQDIGGLREAPEGLYSILISDPFGKEVYSKKDVSLSSFGSFADELLLSDQSPMGYYDVVVNLNGRRNPAFRFLVTDFKPASFQSQVEVSKEILFPETQMEILSSAKLYAGGGLGNASYMLSLILNPTDFTAETPALRDFRFSTGDDQAYADTLFQEELRLDAEGLQSKSLQMPSTDVVHGNIVFESSVSDEQGRSIASYDSAKFYGRDAFVGLRFDSWLMTSQKENALDLVVLDHEESFVEGIEVLVELDFLETKTLRVKSSGETFVERYESTWKKVGNCQVQSKAEIQTCSFTPEKAGSYRFRAEIKDRKGRVHRSELYRYATGSDYVLWTDASGLEIVPEKSRYKVGETARLLVKNSFPGAHGFFSIERYGILSSFSRVFENSTEVIEFEIKPEHVPGIFPSLSLFSGRQDTEKSFKETKLDLGKPKLKSGYAKIEVEPAGSSFALTISTDKEEYRPRERVELKISAEDSKTAEDLELAVVVLDESVFDLLTEGEKAFSPQDGLIQLGALDVLNYDLLSKLVGQISFDTKGMSQGGDGPDGGDVQYRNLIDYVAYWNPAVLLKPGKAQELQFDLPDNLTRWRVLVAAVSKTDQMSLSTTKFVSTLPLEVSALIPNQVLVGDEFEVGLKLLNRQEERVSGKVEVEMSGAMAAFEKRTQEIELEPFQPKVLWFPVKATARGEIVIKAKLESSELSDAVEQKLSVADRRPKETVALYSSSEKDEEFGLFVPKAAIADSVRLSLDLSSTVLKSLTQSFQYMENYPYSCWEQKLSRALSAIYYLDLKEYLSKELKWENAKSQAQSWLSEMPSFQAANGGMAYFVAKDDYVDNYLSAFTLFFLKEAEQRGFEVDEVARDKLIGYLSQSLRQAEKKPASASTAGANIKAMTVLALNRYGEAVFEEARALYEKRDQLNLFGKALLWEAMMHLKEASSIAMATQLENEVLATANRSSGRMSFQERETLLFKSILSSKKRTQCGLLSSILLSEKQNQKSGDSLLVVNELMKSASLKQPLFASTQEIIVCQRAFAQYANQYESAAPQMKLTASISEELWGVRELKAFKDEPETMSKNLPPSDRGQKKEVKITKEGEGRFYSRLGLEYQPTDRPNKSVNAGIEIVREYSTKVNGKWVPQKDEINLKSGDLVRVDLFVRVPVDRYFVVLSDPLPGAVEAVNTQLATASQLNAKEGEIEFAAGSRFYDFKEWSFYSFSRSGFYHREIGFDEVNFYSESLRPGGYHLRYVAQAIAPGRFAAPPARAEEMYSVDVFGESASNQFVSTQAKP